ncbi:ABC transporter ATP-binding protein [Oligoflexus tunisiensis]|uniref:ABC transporter ATP-binding protein n=1 Tax=Oligoflexus tunisiensis TaxID=708132 RepID=UPI000AA162C3|nr:ATP-binding cassette domain-containing protein [Oligoflexus tunisiensis]
MNPLLRVEDLSVRFGGIMALNKVNFEVAEGSITGLIGPNGAGKTTVFNCLTGFYKSHGGAIWFKGADGDVNICTLLGAKLRLDDLTDPRKLLQKIRYGFFGGTHLVARAGVARTFQNIRLFNEMSVLENLLIAQHRLVNRNIISGLFQLPSFRHAEEAAVDRAYQWLKTVKLEYYANHLAGSLSYGNQRRLEIARAMCANPRLICLDEPAAGLNPRETRELADLIRALREEHRTTVLVIEHDMSLVMSITDHVVVLNYGQVIAADQPKAIQEHPKVLAAYLGTEPNL